MASWGGHGTAPMPGGACGLEDGAVAHCSSRHAACPVAPKALIPQNSLAGTLVLGCHMGSRAQGHRLPFVQAKALLQGLRECGSS